MSKDTFYFSHDYNARNDAKIKKLISKHGFLGYGIFWAIIEDLYNNTNVLPTDYDSISFDLRTDRETIESIVKDFGLFVFEGDTFGSLSVQKRLEERNAKSEKARKSVLKRWANKGTDTVVLQAHNDSNTIKESIVNENKGKDKEGFDALLLLFSTILSKTFRSTKNLNNFNARIKEGFTLDNFKTALENIKKDSYHKETNYKHITPEFICRVDKLEKFLAVTPEKKPNLEPYDYGTD